MHQLNTFLQPVSIQAEIQEKPFFAAFLEKKL
jgi:hypothetical protein